MSAHLLSTKTKSVKGRTKAEIESGGEKKREDSAQVCGRARVPVTVHACELLHANVSVCLSLCA